MTKNALGKGLETLFPIDKKNDNNNEIKEISVEDIFPNLEQPRRNFNEAKLAELAQSIKNYGILQPIFVKRHAHGNEIIAGERRWRAAKIAGLEQVPCIVKEIIDDKKLEISLIENIQREDLNPLEEAEAYSELIKKFDYSQQDLSDQLGKDRSTISNIIRLLNLPEKVKELINQSKLSTGHARSILALNNEIDIIQLAYEIVENGYSVRKTEELVRNLLRKNEDQKEKKKIDGSKKGDKKYFHIEEELATIFGTKVDVKDKGGKGRIEIKYHTTEEFGRIIEMMKNINQGV
ncbi:MAG: ParB/RepB/Spo0J family partition protein [bacterium]